MKSRITAYLVTLWVVLTMNLLLPRLLPGDPLSALLDPDSSGYICDADVLNEDTAFGGWVPMPYNKHQFIIGVPDGLTIWGSE